jgi:hypothetical protein
MKGSITSIRYDLSELVGSPWDIAGPKLHMCGPELPMYGSELPVCVHDDNKDDNDA